MARRVRTRVGFEGNVREIEVEVPDDEPEIWGADARLRLVGTRIPRVDGPAKASGAATYTTDVLLPGMLHARMFRAAAPGGTLKSLDVADAAKSPGVLLVRGLRKPGDALLFDGLDLAFLVADAEARLEDALALCRYETEPGPAVVNEEDAMAEGAARVFPDGRSNVTRGGRGGRPGQDPSQAFAAADDAMKGADVVLERTYRTRVQNHTALEPHGVVVRPDADGGVTVWASTQGTFSVLGGIHQALRLPRDKVRVVTEFMGGGFGAKFGPSAPGSGFGVEAARAALELKAPVRCILTRREEHLVGGNRPSSVQTVKMGLKKDGTVLAYTVRSYGTAGAVEQGAGVSNPMIYDLGLTAKEELTVATHSGPQAAFRAPGHPQGSFALECALDEAALALRMDPLEFRRRIDRNPIRLAQYEEGAKRFRWAESRRAAEATRGAVLRRGVGMGSAIWYQAGREGSAVHVTVHRDGAVEVSNGAQDIGTGTRTLLAVLVAEVLGLDVGDVKVNLGRTEWPEGPGSGGSTTAPSLGPCARAAAEKARAHVLGERRPAGLKVWKEACRRMEEEKRTFEGRRPPTYAQFHGQVAGVQFVEVEVDAETGVVRVLRALAMQDCGRVVDRLTAESQVIGGVINGISYALFEERILDRATGRMLNGDLEAYRLAGSRDIPAVEVVLTDVANAGNSVGMMGLGEPPKVPTAGAVANAVSHALGVRVREIPLTPARVVAAIEEGGR